MLLLNKIEFSQLAPSLYHLLLINLELLPLKSIKRKKSNSTLVQLRFLKKEKEKVKIQISLIMMKEACSLIIIILTISRTKRKLSPLLKSSNNIKRLKSLQNIQERVNNHPVHSVQNQNQSKNPKATNLKQGNNKNQIGHDTNQLNLFSSDNSIPILDMNYQGNAID